MYACHGHHLFILRINEVTTEEKVKLVQSEFGEYTNEQTVDLQVLVSDWRIFRGKVQKRLAGHIWHACMAHGMYAWHDITHACDMHIHQYD